MIFKWWGLNFPYVYTKQSGYYKFLKKNIKKKNKKKLSRLAAYLEERIWVAVGDDLAGNDNNDGAPSVRLDVGLRIPCSFHKPPFLCHVIVVAAASS